MIEPKILGKIVKHFSSVTYLRVDNTLLFNSLFWQMVSSMEILIIPGNWPQYRNCKHITFYFKTGVYKSEVRWFPGGCAFLQNVLVKLDIPTSNGRTGWFCLWVISFLASVLMGHHQKFWSTLGLQKDELFLHLVYFIFQVQIWCQCFH